MHQLYEVRDMLPYNQYETVHLLWLDLVGTSNSSVCPPGLLEAEGDNLCASPLRTYDDWVDDLLLS